MRWIDDLKIEDSGQILYKGIEVELTCMNLMHLLMQGNVKERLDKEVVESVRELKLDILLSGR